MLIVRQHTGGRYTVGAYLVDTWCRGLRDTFFNVRLEESELQDLLERFAMQGIEGVDESVPIIEYEFGLNGKHYFVAGSEADLDRYLPTLRENLGEGNFTYTVRLGGPYEL